MKMVARAKKPATKTAKPKVKARRKTIAKTKARKAA
jgi:hypothetical protein